MHTWQNARIEMLISLTIGCGLFGQTLPLRAIPKAAVHHWLERREGPGKVLHARNGRGATAFTRNSDIDTFGTYYCND